MKRYETRAEKPNTLGQNKYSRRKQTRSAKPNTLGETKKPNTLHTKCARRTLSGQTGLRPYALMEARNWERRAIEKAKKFHWNKFVSETTGPDVWTPVTETSTRPLRDEEGTIAISPEEMDLMIIQSAPLSSPLPSKSSRRSLFRTYNGDQGDGGISPRTVLKSKRCMGRQNVC